jgi:hypothetical protein
MTPIYYIANWCPTLFILPVFRPYASLKHKREENYDDGSIARELPP